MEWFGFWIFAAVLVVVDGWLYSKGHDGVFFEHKTDEEKELQRLMFKEQRRKAEASNAGAEGPERRQARRSASSVELEGNVSTEDTMHQSNALWPDGVCSSMYGDNISTDTHPTERHAEAACTALEREGFGGEGKLFPLLTWVSDVQQPPRLPGRECNACDWSGSVMDCCWLGTIGPLCPECRETTMPSNAALTGSPEAQP